MLFVSQSDSLTPVAANLCFSSPQHRVQTILDSDHILVLSDGRIAEYDTPENLLAQEDGIFASLVNAGT